METTVPVRHDVQMAAVGTGSCFVSSMKKEDSQEEVDEHL